MPVSARKGAVPESDTRKVDRKPQGPRAYKGAMVPSEALEASKPSSPPEALPNPETPDAPPILVQQMPEPTPPPSPPPSSTAPYSGWRLLGLKTDPTDPSRQWEIRCHPVTGEVVDVPVGKAAAEASQILEHV